MKLSFIKPQVSRQRAETVTTQHQIMVVDLVMGHLRINKTALWQIAHIVSISFVGTGLSKNSIFKLLA